MLNRSGTVLFPVRSELTSRDLHCSRETEESGRYTFRIISPKDDREVGKSELDEALGNCEIGPPVVIIDSLIQKLSFELAGVH